MCIKAQNISKDICVNKKTAAKYEKSTEYGKNLSYKQMSQVVSINVRMFLHLNKIWYTGNGKISTNILHVKCVQLSKVLTMYVHAIKETTIDIALVQCCLLPLK